MQNGIVVIKSFFIPKIKKKTVKCLKYLKITLNEMFYFECSQERLERQICRATKKKKKEKKR